MIYKKMRRKIIKKQRLPIIQEKILELVDDAGQEKEELAITDIASIMPISYPTAFAHIRKLEAIGRVKIITPKYDRRLRIIKIIK